MIFKYIRHRSKRVLGIVQEPLEKEGSQKKINSDLNSWQTRKVQSFVVFEKGKKERNKKKCEDEKIIAGYFYNSCGFNFNFQVRGERFVAY